MRNVSYEDLEVERFKICSEEKAEIIVALEMSRGRAEGLIHVLQAQLDVPWANAFTCTLDAERMPTPELETTTFLCGDGDEDETVVDVNWRNVIAIQKSSSGCALVTVVGEPIEIPWTPEKARREMERWNHEMAGQPSPIYAD